MPFPFFSVRLISVILVTALLIPNFPKKNIIQEQFYDIKDLMEAL